jgi:phosphatidylinositol-4,5-bisphosphate 3-kinase
MDSTLSGLEISGCRAMSSKMVPLWLKFKNALDSKHPAVVLFKQGDDLRQDQLTIQLIRVMDIIWKEDNLDLQMTPYNVTSTGEKLGMIEVVQHANTVAGIISSSVSSARTSFGKAYAAAFSNEDAIRNWLHAKCIESEMLLEQLNKKDIDEFGSPQSNHRSELEQQTKLIELATDNLIRSCAGYCVATYALGIGDRHPSNLMITSDGRFLHIDFGHFLGNFKSKYGFKREKAPFVLTPQMAKAMGGRHSKGFALFTDYCCRAFNLIRKKSDHLISLFVLMVCCGIPELSSKQDIEWLREHLLLTKIDRVTQEVVTVSDKEASEEFVSLINQSLGETRTEFNNFCHILKHA